MQGIIDRLAKSYDEREMTREGVWYELEGYVEQGVMTLETAERLFDIIV